MDIVGIEQYISKGVMQTLSLDTCCPGWSAPGAQVGLRERLVFIHSIGVQSGMQRFQGQAFLSVVHAMLK